MKLTETILHKAAPYPVVAFDVFDTLIKRDVARPTDLFALLGADFAKARVQAETQARAAKSGEVTLAEIYARPCLAEYDPAAERAAEIACAVPNLPVLQAARALHAQGKRLYYISDMYLPKAHLDAMLAKCGYDFFDGGFVSADYGVQKRSGKLFRLFLQKTQTQAKEVLFIGDSWRADIAGSSLAGIRAWHLPTQEVPRESLPAGAVAAFTANRLPGLSGAEACGFSVLGPLAVAYCQWLHTQAQQHPEAKIHFLARDMYLMRQVYALLYPQEQTAYLQVSRRSLCPLLLAQGQWELLLAALPRQQLTGAQIAAYCGTTCQAEQQSKTFDLKREPDTACLLLQALTAPPSAVTVSAYLARQNLRAGDILVDIGSGGTTQMLLQAVCNIKLHGCQLSCDDRLRGRLGEDETVVFLFDGQPASLLYWAGQPMLERLISEDVGATLGYTQTDANTITVQQAPQPPAPLLADLQKGILRFAEEWQNSFLQTLTIPPQTAIAPFLRLVGQPTAGETALLGDLTVEDGGVYPLAAPRGGGYYLTHANQAKRDLSAARWKIGFLKRLAPLPLPYDRLYAKMKK